MFDEIVEESQPMRVSRSTWQVRKNTYISHLDNRVVWIRPDQAGGPCKGTILHFQLLKLIGARLSLSDDAGFEDDGEDDRFFGGANAIAIPLVICDGAFERSIGKILEDFGGFRRQFHVCR